MLICWKINLRSAFFLEGESASSKFFVCSGGLFESPTVASSENLEKTKKLKAFKPCSPLRSRSGTKSKAQARNVRLRCIKPGARVEVIGLQVGEKDSDVWVKSHWESLL